MAEPLVEFIDSRALSLRVDREAGVIRGVKVLGLESQNGRSYLAEALAAAVGLYEGAKVNVNHPKSLPGAPRDYQDRIGSIRNAAVRTGEGLFADLHFNPRHALAGQLAWDAEHAPENVGFSHNVLAKTARRGERVVVEAITKVQSVDLVADPATTRDLFEAAVAAGSTSQVDAERRERILESLTAAELERRRPDLVEALCEGLARDNARLRGELDAVRIAEAMAGKRATAERLLAEFRLPSPSAADDWARRIVSDEFFESLLTAADEPAMRRLVEERARLVTAAAGLPARRSSAVRPLSRDQFLVEDYGAEELDAAAFARAIS
ncbi:MAG: hypothetical protein HYX69_18740 [Planctomycetia bacterium]|nr:hypothetical protein [Planctomycetia bacterium]